MYRLMELRRRMHEPFKETGIYVRSVVVGHLRYYGVPMNYRALDAFRQGVRWLWGRSLQRRSQRGWIPLDPIYRITERWIPHARICHPNPLDRLGVITRGRSRVR